MAIKFHPDSAIYDYRTDTVRVPAIDDNKLVVCAIAHDAIRKALWYEDGPAAFLLDTYHRFQHAFHIIANYKYRTRHIEPDGVVLVMAADFAAPNSPWDETETIN